MKQSFKFFFGVAQPVDTRRVPVSVPPPSWPQFLDLLDQIFGVKFHPELSVFYKDDEEELVRVTSQIEWEEALDVLGENRIVKIFIRDTGKPLFKDSGAPEPRFLYAENPATGEKQKIRTSKNQLSILAQDVSRCISKLFNGGKILPYNLPDWLKTAVKIRPVEGEEEVDIDIDIDQLKSVLFDKGLQFLNGGLFQKGKDCFEALLVLDVKRPVVLYNLACAESLLGQTEAAFKRLHEAIDNGYSNLNHLLSDADFDHIKLLPAFDEVINRLRERLGISIPIPPQEEEIKPEQKHDQEPEEEQQQEEEEEREDSDNEEESNEVSLEPTPVEEISKPAEQEEEVDPYAHQKALLREMGFDIDDELLQLALVYSDGDLSVAITNLLMQSMDR